MVSFAKGNSLQRAIIDGHNVMDEQNGCDLPNINKCCLNS
jgi:hypothetical protein